MRKPFNTAQATPDPVIRRLSSAVSDHPFDVPAYGMTLDVTLTDEQRLVAEAVLAGEGAIRSLVRSAIAQLGIDIDASDVRLNGSRLEVEGHLLVTPDSAAERVMELMQKMHRQADLAVGRAAILPHGSRLTRVEVVEAVRSGRLSAAGAAVTPDGMLQMPLQPGAHAFRTDQPSETVLADILTGRKSGRLALQEVRDVTGRPARLHPREFLVGEIDLHTRDCHVMLEPATVDALGRPTTAVHLGAFLLDAGRTQQSARHVELWNANGKVVDLDGLRVSAGVYRAGHIMEPGI